MWAISSGEKLIWGDVFFVDVVADSGILRRRRCVATHGWVAFSVETGMASRKTARAVQYSGEQRLPQRKILLPKIACVACKPQGVRAVAVSIANRIKALRLSLPQQF